MDELKPQESEAPAQKEGAAQTPDTEATGAAVDALLKFGALTEPDKTMATDAYAFVNAPTDNLAEIDGHLKNVGEVLTGFMMTGEDAPAEVDALHADLQKLFCQHHINALKDELAKTEPDTAALDLAMRMALDSAMNLSKGYQIPSYLEEVQKLQAGIRKGTDQ